MTLYFAYGSNQDENQMRDRCPCSKLIGKAVLKDYKLAYTFKCSTHQTGCADILESKGDEVWGLLYEVSEEDLKRLDGFEKHPVGYGRFIVTVSDEFGKERKAEVYEVVEKIEGNVEPSRKYHDILVNASKKHDFPDSYKKFLDSFGVQD